MSCFLNKTTIYKIFCHFNVYEFLFNNNFPLLKGFRFLFFVFILMALYSSMFFEGIIEVFFTTRQPFKCLCVLYISQFTMSLSYIYTQKCGDVVAGVSHNNKNNNPIDLKEILFYGDDKDDKSKKQYRQIMS